MPTVIHNVTDEFLDMIKLPSAYGGKLNYLVVMPKLADLNSQYIFPVGLGIVTSALKASGRTVFTLNLTYQESPLELLQNTIVDHNIDVVATGGLSGQYEEIRQIIDTVKKVSENIITIVGGGIITADPEVAMTALENVDFGVIGEGEITITEIAYALENESDMTGVCGVIAKDPSGGFVAPPPRGEIMNLDCLPFPDYDGFDYAECFKRKFSGTGIADDIGAVITASRSCPYNCTFCFHSSGKKYRRRSLDSVFNEIDLLREKYSFKLLQLADELFGDDLSYVEEFCDRIRDYKLSFRIQTRLDRVTDRLLQLLSESGCKEISFGIEHTVDKILESMQKRTKAAYIVPALCKCKEYGITPVGSIIFGDPAETEQTVKEALEWWKQHKHLGNIRTTYLIVFPGSLVYKEAVKREIIKDPVQFLRDGSPLVNVTAMTDETWSSMKDLIANYRILYERSSHTSADKLIENLERLTETGQTVGIWPATIDSIRFFRGMSKAFFDKAVMLNVNPDSQMIRESVERFVVYKPEVIPQKNIEIIVCPRESLIEQIKYICASEYPMVKRVLSVSELADETLE